LRTIFSPVLGVGGSRLHLPRLDLETARELGVVMALGAVTVEQVARGARIGVARGQPPGGGERQGRYDRDADGVAVHGGAMLSPARVAGAGP